MPSPPPPAPVPCQAEIEAVAEKLAFVQQAIEFSGLEAAMEALDACLAEQNPEQQISPLIESAVASLKEAVKIVKQKRRK
jgi:hypothetical protein